MKYIDLKDYKNGWVFRHQDLPLSDDDLAGIKPLGAQMAGDIWRTYISAEAVGVESFDKNDWPAKESSWCESADWQTAWEDDAVDLPAELQAFIDWQPETLVYFCFDAEHVIETRWAIFRRAWKNFLFFDDGPILIGKKRPQAVQFFSDGQLKLGKRT